MVEKRASRPEMAFAELLFAATGAHLEIRGQQHKRNRQITNNTPQKRER
jgi:hypothetical protein